PREPAARAGTVLPRGAPDPDHLLRVSTALALRRARLKTVYAILNGRDLENGEPLDLDTARRGRRRAPQARPGGSALLPARGRRRA
ncbi:MAG TPA: hypothetical protein PK413_17455, partial [Thermoanaerobaculia bacterium]|nr:hypothetical protein [Thermoanaerobaculia bacterium]